MQNPEVTPEENNSKEHEIDILSLMQSIKDKIINELGTVNLDLPPFNPTNADPNTNGKREAGELVHSETLRYLNFNHTKTLSLDPAKISTHRNSILGKIVVACKRRLLVWLGDLLRDYLSDEIAYRSNLVRFLNSQASYIDARDSTQFWEIIKKIDADNSQILKRLEIESQEHRTEIVALERRLTNEIRKHLGSINEVATANKNELTTIKSVVKGLEAIIAQLNSSNDTVNGYMNTVTPTLNGNIPEFRYLLLENRFRGSEVEVKSRLGVYVDIFRSSSDLVYEIGAGRGELQELFNENNIPTKGVDIDPAMVARCHQKNLDITCDDGLVALAKMEDHSLGGVIALEVIEHFTVTQLDQLLKISARKVKSGGLVVLETINPTSLVSLSSNYFRDPTHVMPVHPDTLSYLMELAGMEVLEIKMLSPIPQEALFQHINSTEYLSPKWLQAVQGINTLIDQLNKVIYGYQEYCVIARIKASH
jgi:2-polyprenyl-3-methyl-5-hydroxy-6-metoxy-1,4-benzoquinol methylase